MIEHVVSQVVRRSLQHTGGLNNMYKRAAEEGSQAEIPTWGAAILYFTFVASLIFMTSVEYTLKDLIATLVMVETPSAAITVSTPDEPASRDEKEGLLETGPTITLVHQKPITSSIRATSKHLKAQGGRLARFRGFGIHILYSMVFGVVVNIFTFAIHVRFSPVTTIIATALAGAATAPLHAAWTNKIISVPSAISFRQRFPSRSSWKVLAVPAAINAAMPTFSLFIIHGSINLLGLYNVTDINEFNAAQWTFLILRWIAVVLITISCSLFLYLPAIVALIRTEASLLPEDQDTIVPFDRTFDGKVVPQILGGTGALKFVDAWKSFNWEARRRLVKHYVKTFFIVVGMVFFVAHLLAFELFAVMGPQLGKLIAEGKENFF